MSNTSQTQNPNPPANGRGNGTNSDTALGQIWSGIRALFGIGGEQSLRESLEDAIEQHAADSDNDVTAEERFMLRNILDFGSQRIEDVMVPRADIMAVEDETRLSELFNMFIEANHSRLPVYRETLDEPLGMVHVKDLVHWLAKSAKKARSRKPTTDSKTKTRKNAALRGSEKTLNLAGIDLSISVAKAGIIRDRKSVV